MGSNPQIFLLAPREAGLEIVFERLEEVGYSFRDFSEVPQIGPGVVLFPISRRTDFKALEQQLEEKRKLNPELLWIAIYVGKLQVKSQYIFGLGFQELYQIPLDEEIFTNRIFETLPIEIDPKNLRFDHLLRVNLPFFRDLPKAPFDVFIYLPSNKKIMLYQKAGNILDQVQLEKFAKHKNHALFIRKSDIGKYKACASESFGRVKMDPSLDDAQKMSMIQENMQILMAPLFSEGELEDEEARQTVMQIQEVLRGLQISPTIEKESIESLERLSSQKMTNASHARNVSAYCAMFGVALGMTNIDELRLGGLLHDVGLADLPLELLAKDDRQMSEEDRARYHLHPGNGRQDVINRNVPVTETILNMILLHHERMDGSGYPYGKKMSEIPVEAQICAFADEFDKLTSFREGYRCYSAADALLLLSGKLGAPPSTVFNPDVHQKIVDFYFLKNPQAKVDVSPATNSHGEVRVHDPRGDYKIERKQLSNPIGLSQISAKLPSTGSVSLSIDKEIEFEVSALEKELEFYFLEK